MLQLKSLVTTCVLRRATKLKPFPAQLILDRATLGFDHFPTALCHRRDHLVKSWVGVTRFYDFLFEVVERIAVFLKGSQNWLRLKRCEVGKRFVGDVARRQQGINALNYI